MKFSKNNNFKNLINKLRSKVIREHNKNELNLINFEDLYNIQNFSHLELIEIYNIRNSAKYINTINEFNPSFSVVIPTHTNPKVLGERTIESILALKNMNYEIIVVAENEKIYTQLLNSNYSKYIKVIENKFQEFSINRIKREDSHLLNYGWLNSGTGGFLTGCLNASKNWIIPMAHDDEFPDSDSVYNLYSEMNLNQSEIILGQIKQISPDGKNDRLFTNNPLIQSNYGIQGSIIYSDFAKFLFKFTDNSFGIANDWGFVSRVLAYNLRLKISSRIMANYYPSTLWSNQ